MAENFSLENSILALRLWVADRSSHSEDVLAWHLKVVDGKNIGVLVVDKEVSVNLFPQQIEGLEINLEQVDKAAFIQEMKVGKEINSAV